MDYVILGAGAIGSLFGGMLSGKHAVTLVARGAHARAVASRGLRVSGITEAIYHPSACTDLGAVDKPDAIIIAVKAYDTKAAAGKIKARFGSAVPVISLQNGLGNLETIAATLGEGATVIGLLTSHGVTLKGPGELVHAGVGETLVGPCSTGPSGDLAKAMASELTRAGIEARAVEDLKGHLWLKAGVNACINPLTAILGCQNGRLLEYEGLLDTMRAIAGETSAAARGGGVDLGSDVILARAKQVASDTAGNRSSMLQDIERGKRTEVDWICGKIAEAAEANGSPAPINRALAGLIHALEGNR